MKVRDLINLLEHIQNKELDIRVIDTNGNMLEEVGADIEDVTQVIQYDTKGTIIYALLRTD